MRRFNKIRVAYFQDLLARERRIKPSPDAAREIVRKPGNPMLRYGKIASADGAESQTQETLNL